MQEQKKIKIEKVYHSFTTIHDTCCLIDFYPSENESAQFNYTSYCFSKTAKTYYSIGCWRPKSLKIKNYER